ncbi:type II secretion system protein [Azospirillum sp. B4]|uniref:type II secretion system protein n=1 Tax=Azospirillum sp. B4 TaxID=95605 RepID=UPI0005CA5D20
MRASRGFTLLEMLIALTIFSLVTALLMQNAWSGAWAARQAWTEAAALRLAQSLAVAGPAVPVVGDRPDPIVGSLPFRIKGEPVQDDDATYRVTVSELSGGPLAVATARPPWGRWP